MCKPLDVQRIKVNHVYLIIIGPEKYAKNIKIFVYKNGMMKLGMFCKYENGQKKMLPKINCVGTL